MCQLKLGFWLLVASSATGKVLAFSTSTTTRLHTERVLDMPVISVTANTNSRTHSALTRLQASTNTDMVDVDTDALTKYATSGIIQMSSFFALFTAMDSLVSVSGIEVPFAANCAFFYLCSLRSRIFNPLSNDRPNVASVNDESITIRPSWTPPGVVFPIMWLLIIGPLRAYSASLVYMSTDSYASVAILSFFLHLSIGDIWNTINNVEKRYGPATIGVFLVWCSAANAAFQYSQVDQFAGELLGLTLVWLTVAAALIASTWKLNPDETTGELTPLYPVKGDVETTFAWFGGKES